MTKEIIQEISVLKQMSNITYRKTILLLQVHNILGISSEYGEL